MGNNIAIELKNITKTFGAKVIANKDVNLIAYKGEILSILGENGSGKTTLMNMISGIYFPDEGQIFVDGKEAVIASPKDAFEYGIGIRVDEETAEFDLAEMERAGYRIWNVKPGTYVVFDCIGEDGDCISDTWTKFYKEFLPQMGYDASEETDYEIYFEKGRSGVFCELWIPVKKK